MKENYEVLEVNVVKLGMQDMLLMSSTGGDNETEVPPDLCFK